MYIPIKNPFRKNILIAWFRIFRNKKNYKFCFFKKNVNQAKIGSQFKTETPWHVQLTKVKAKSNDTLRSMY